MYGMEGKRLWEFGMTRTRECEGVSNTEVTYVYLMSSLQT